MKFWRLWVVLLLGNTIGAGCVAASPMPTVFIPPVPTGNAHIGPWRKLEPFTQTLKNRQAIDKFTSSKTVWRFGVHLRDPLVNRWLLEEHGGRQRHICGGADRPTPYGNQVALHQAVRQAFISRAEMTRMAEMTRQLGATFGRVNLRWDAVECQAQGKYYFAPYQELVEIFGRQGLGIQFILTNPNDFYPAPASAKSQWAPFRPPQVSGFARFAQQAAQTFKNNQVAFEIWNEANTDTFWQDGAANDTQKGQNFAFLVNRATQAIKAVHPRALVVSGGTFNVPGLFLQQVARGANNIDALGIHLYARNHPESFDDEWQNITQARQYQKPVFMTESGISGTGFDSSGGFLADYQRDEQADRPIARDRQASWYVRLLLKMWTKGVDQVVLYELQDQARSSKDFTLRELNYGLYDQQGLKPAGRAVQQLSKFLQQGDNSKALLYRGGADNHQVQVLALDGNSSRRLIVWLRRPSAKALAGILICVPNPQKIQTWRVKNMLGVAQPFRPIPCAYGGVMNGGMAIAIKDVHGLTYLEF